MEGSELLLCGKYKGIPVGWATEQKKKGTVRCMAILLTGGAGYIGSHTAVELLEKGEQVIIADNFANSNSSVVERIELITGRCPKLYQVDVADRAAMRQIFSENDIHAVIHFAGFKAPKESVNEPLKYYRNNLDTTMTMLEVMREFKVNRLIFSSSAAVYGVPKQLPVTEDMPTLAINPYGQTKLMIEQMLQDLATVEPGWDIVILRYFNPVGAHPSGQLGEEPNGIPNNLMPYMSKVAGGELKELHIYGNDYPTVDGTGVRDYIHVVDLARGHISALDFSRDHNGVFVFNLGTGKPHSVMEVVNAFEAACGHKIPFVIEARRPGDGAVCFASTEKANQMLGWRAEKTLQDMCNDTWRWQKHSSHIDTADESL